MILKDFLAGMHIAIYPATADAKKVIGSVTAENGETATNVHLIQEIHL